MALRVTGNLICLERGSGELLLANSFHMRPLYVARGRERIKRLLSTMPSGLALADLRAAVGSDGALIDLLHDYRILVDAIDKERYDQTEIRARIDAPRPRPRMTVYLLLTEACNLGCVYCLNGRETYQREGDSMMTREVALSSVIASLEQLSPGGHLEIAFFGGEPLLNWRLLRDVIAHCEAELKPCYADKKITYHLTSNLSLCPPDLVPLLRDHGVTVMCDIDGPPELHDRCRPDRHGRPSFARTAETIRRLAGEGVPVALRATITALNQDHIFDIAAQHKDLGATNSALVPVSPVDSDRNFLVDDLLPDIDTVLAGLIATYRSGMWDKNRLFPFNQYVLQLRPGARQVTACAAPSGTTPVIRANGDVYTCIYLVGQERHRFGSLGSEWDRSRLDDMLEGLHVDGIQGCATCPWRYACGAGCPVSKLAQEEGARPSPKAARYSRALSCDFNSRLLAEILWDIADEVAAGVTGLATPGEPPARIC